MGFYTPSYLASGIMYTFSNLFGNYREATLYKSLWVLWAEIAIPGKPDETPAVAFSRRIKLFPAHPMQATVDQTEELINQIWLKYIETES